MNKVILKGRLGSTPELKATQSGISVVSVSIAVNDRKKNEDGTYNTTWIPIVAWRERADFLAKYFVKGQEILIEGRIQVRKYKDKNGNDRTATEIVVDNIEFCGSKSDNAQYGGQTAPQQTKPAGQAVDVYYDDYSDISDADDGLPF